METNALRGAGGGGGDEVGPQLQNGKEAASNKSSFPLFWLKLLYLNKGV